MKLGDGGRADGYSAGKASGSIISRIVRSYWEDENVYSAELQGVVIPGADTAISKQIAGRELLAMLRTNSAPSIAATSRSVRSAPMETRYVRFEDLASSGVRHMMHRAKVIRFQS